jgi:acyl-CoA synthetase (AMP-forming)/AMP-acid ligase II
MPQYEAVPLHTGEPASIFFTSGSTGLPKGVTQSHQNLLWGAATVGACLGYRPDDRILCGIPWAFDYGWGQLLSTFVLGITQVIPSARTSIALCDAMAQHKPTVLPGVPALFGDLVRGVAPIRDTERGSIRLLTNTGSKIPPSLFPELLDVFPNAAVSLNY